MVHVFEPEDLPTDPNEGVLCDVLGGLSVPGQDERQSKRVGTMCSVQLSQSVLAHDFLTPHQPDRFSSSHDLYTPEPPERSRWWRTRRALCFTADQGRLTKANPDQLGALISGPSVALIDGYRDPLFPAYAFFSVSLQLTTR